MPLRVLCPGCGFVGQVPDTYSGRVITCPKCKNQFAANGAGASATATTKTAPAPTKAAAPPPAPRPQPPKKKSLLPWIAAGVAAFFLGGAGVGGFLVWSSWDSIKKYVDNSVPVAVADTRDKTSEKSPSTESGPATTKEESPKKEDPVALPESIPVATLQAIKEATVFIKVQAGPGEASGSGFLMQAEGDSGYIVTNQHVITPPPELRFTGKVKVTLVFRSGTDKEQSVPGEILAADKSRDLAILKFSDVKNLPKPIDFAVTPDLVELMPVYVFGFPFGQYLAAGKGNPAITVGKGSVSSIRKNDNGKLARVQIDGALNPGNSGGPVVDARGRLVGVAVTTIRGANIGNLIPPDELRELLGGRVAAVAVMRKKAKGAGAELQGEFWLIDDRNAIVTTVSRSKSIPGAAPADGDRIAEIHVEALLLDPLNHVKAIHVHHVGKAVLAKLPAAAKDGSWPPLSDSDKVPLTITERTGQVTFNVPVAKKDADHHFQLSYEGADGKVTYTQPRTLRIDGGAGETVVSKPPDDPVKPPMPRPTTPTERVTIPGKDALANAEKLIKDLFKDEYAKKKPADLLALSETLHKQAIETPDDPAARYVLLTESADLAARAGEVGQALKVVEDLVAGFEVNAGTLKAGILEKADAVVRTKDGSKALAEEVQTAIREALASDDFDAADKLVAIGESAARKAQSAPLIASFGRSTQEIKNFREEFARVKVALTALEKKPTDAEANLTAGKYYCLVKGDWDKGLVMLAQGSDTKLKELAEKDALTPTKADDQKDVGDAWYEYGAAQEAATIKTQAYLRAGYWYAQALPSLTGITRTKVEKRLTELDKIADKTRSYGEAIKEAREAVKEGRTKKTATIGFGIGKDADEVPPEGALLIGFEVGLGKFFDNDVVDSIRPIYLTSRGEKFGEQVGKQGARLVTVKAKPGYAVGGMKLKGGLGVDGFALTFMRIDKQGLKKDDAYTSDWIGGKGGNRETAVGGDGSMVVGICMKMNDQNKACALGLVTAPPRAK